MANKMTNLLFETMAEICTRNVDGIDQRVVEILCSEIVHHCIFASYYIIVSFTVSKLFPIVTDMFI